MSRNFFRETLPGKLFCHQIKAFPFLQPILTIASCLLFSLSKEKFLEMQSLFSRAWDRLTFAKKSPDSLCKNANLTFLDVDARVYDGSDCPFQKGQASKARNVCESLYILPCFFQAKFLQTLAIIGNVCLASWRQNFYDWWLLVILETWI